MMIVRIAATLALALATSRAVAAPNPCRAACKATRATCLGSAQGAFVAARQGCKLVADAADRHACVKAARTARATARGTCRAAFKPCAAACTGTGGACRSHAGGWLATVNAYRALADLPAVAEDPAL